MINMINKLVEKLNTKKSIYSVVKSMLPHPKHWPKKLHEIRLDRYFLEVFGRHADFKNPKTFNEKILWYMINFTDEIASTVIDKVQFKEFVREKLGEGYTAELYGVWDNAEDIDLSDIEVPFVLKSNCSGDGQNMAIITDESQITDGLKNRMREWLKWQNTFINGSSNAYYRVKPRILAEEYLEGLDGTLADYKFFCFDGEPYCAYTSVHHSDSQSEITFYDMDWNVMDVFYADFQKNAVGKPNYFEEMKRIAANLSEGFPFVRADFYETTKGLKVGELTLFSGGGLSPFNPDSFDYELGEKFVLPPKKCNK